MAFLTGKANITGGNIYGTEFCPLYIGKPPTNCINNFSRVNELFTKHIDLEGTLSIKDSTNTTRIELDENNILTLSGFTNIDSLIINNALTITNAEVSCLLQNNKQFNITRTNTIPDTNYLCNITSDNALQITGNCNLIGELYINDESLDTTISHSIDAKFDSLSTIQLSELNDIAGIFINTANPNETSNGSGLIWKNNKFNLLQNLQYTDNTVINNGSYDEYAPICVGELTSSTHHVNNIYSSNIYQSIFTYDLSTVTATITNIDTSTHGVSRFTNSSTSCISFKLLNPTITTHTINHHLIADNNFTGIVEIEGDFVFPNGVTSSTKKISLTQKGQNILLTYMCGHWYITNGGVNIV